MVSKWVKKYNSRADSKFTDRLFLFGLSVISESGFHLFNGLYPFPPKVIHEVK